MDYQFACKPSNPAQKSILVGSAHPAMVSPEPKQVSETSAVNFTPIFSRQQSALGGLLECLCSSNWEEVLRIRRLFAEHYDRQKVVSLAIALLREDGAKYALLEAVCDPVFMSNWAEVDATLTVSCMRKIIAQSKSADVRIGAIGEALNAIRKDALKTVNRHLHTQVKLAMRETRMLDFVLNLAAESDEMRTLVVRMMMKNERTRTGHFTVNRARQALRLVARMAGVRRLIQQLDSADPELVEQAVYLMGRVNNQAVVPHLLRMYKRQPRAMQNKIEEALYHYSIFNVAGLADELALQDITKQVN